MFKKVFRRNNPLSIKLKDKSNKAIILKLNNSDLHLISFTDHEASLLKASHGQEYHPLLLPKLMPVKCGISDELYNFMRDEKGHFCPVDPHNQYREDRKLVNLPENLEANSDNYHLCARVRMNSGKYVFISQKPEYHKDIHRFICEIVSDTQDINHHFSQHERYGDKYIFAPRLDCYYDNKYHFRIVGFRINDFHKVTTFYSQMAGFAGKIKENISQNQAIQQQFPGLLDGLNAVEDIYVNIAHACMEIADFRLTQNISERKQANLPPAQNIKYLQNRQNGLEDVGL